MKAGERSIWHNYCLCTDALSMTSYMNHRLIRLCPLPLPLRSVSYYYVPCGLHSDRDLLPGSLPLTPPWHLLLDPPPTRFRHACTLGGLLCSLARLLPRAEGNRHRVREHPLKHDQNHLLSPKRRWKIWWMLWQKHDWLYFDNNSTNSFLFGQMTAQMWEEINERRLWIVCKGAPCKYFYDKQLRVNIKKVSDRPADYPANDPCRWGAPARLLPNQLATDGSASVFRQSRQVDLMEWLAVFTVA